jgi:3-oxoacyl-[acyl-carrier protein] reductase
MTYPGTIQVNLEGKVAIVTGAGRGIGRAVAESFVSAGAAVVAVDILESVMTMEERFLSHWYGHKADVSKPEEVSSLIDCCVSKVGTPDILINVAAISTPSLVKAMTLDNWRTNIDVNLTSVFLCAQAVLPYMIDKKSGSIISFSSVIARTGGENSAHYSAAKAGIESFSKSLAREVGPYGVRVNVVSPGIIETKMLELMPDQQKQSLIKRLPLRRVGYPNDLVGLPLFLVSDSGSYITGQTIHVNGGLFMG